MTQDLLVEVVFVTPESESLQEIRLPVGATVADAVEASKLQAQFPDLALGDLPVGIWGRVVTPAQVLKSGDRVEIYRELQVDPMAARRIRATAPDPDPSESR